MTVKQKPDKDIVLMHVMFNHDECLLLQRQTKTKDVDAPSALDCVRIDFIYVGTCIAIIRNANMWWETRVGGKITDANNKPSAWLSLEP